MKKIFSIVSFSLLMLLMVSCKDDNKIYRFSINGINTSGIKYLTIASESGSNSKSSSQYYLYSIDENGDMNIVAYEYQCEDDGTATELSRNLTLVINQIVLVGDNYIWLVGCRYQCDDYSGFSESMQDNIRGIVRHSEESNFGENFLIRKSDGKIFDLNDVVVRFPIGSYHFPGLGNVGLVSDNGMPIDGDITGDRMRKLGLINQVDGDIFLASGSWLGNLHKLHDNGNTLSMIEVLPGSAGNYINIAYSVTDNQGHIGTCIGYSGNHPDVAAIMAPDGTFPAIQGIPVLQNGSSANPEMRCIGGKFFVSVYFSRWDGDNYIGIVDSIYRVDINGSVATATAVAKGHFTEDECETYNTIVYVSDEECYSWYSCSSLYTFNSTTYQLTESTLPSGWPQYSLFDAEGHHYRSHVNNGLQSFTIYSLATLQTEEVVCNRSQVPSFNFMQSCSYDGGIKAFVESVIMADGSTAAIVTPVTGDDRGVSRLESRTGANNNVVVNTLIPLN